jgi:hypothetical protein
MCDHDCGYISSLLPLWSACRPNLPSPSSEDFQPHVEEFIWRTGCFAGEFGDAFIVNTNLEGGDVPATMELLVRLLSPLVECEPLSQSLLSSFTPQEVTSLAGILDELRNAVQWGRRLNAVRDRPQRFLSFLNDWRTAVRDLPIGKRLVVNGGWLVAYRAHKCTFLPLFCTASLLTML